MTTLLLTVLAASLAGSLHCAGMCGALVAFAVSTPSEPTRSPASLHVLYHGGRLAIYAVIGAICGSIGAVLDMGGGLVGLQRVAACIAGGLMVLVGVVALLRTTRASIPHFPVPAALQHFLVRAQSAAAALQPAPRAAAIGLLSGLLPCGWLYVFAITAASTANALWGAAVMAAFWAGTVPVLLSVGVSTQFLARWLGKRLPLLTSTALIGLGLFTIAGRVSIDSRAFAAERPPENEVTTTEQAIERVESLDAAKAPCCQHGG